MARKAKRWQIEEAGIRLRLFRNGRRWWADVRVGGDRRRLSLGTIEKSMAETNARALAKEIAAQRLLGVRPDTLTLGQLFQWYGGVMASILNKKGGPVSAAWKQAAEMRIALFIAAWGEDLPVVDIDQTRANDYAARRLSGALSPLAPEDTKHGRQSRPVRARTVDADMVWLKSVINYGRKYRRNGQPLVRGNPLDGVSWPREKRENERRPRASAARYAATQVHTDAIDPAGRLRCALALARFTGHRESAILNLWASDILLSPERIASALAAVGRAEADAEHMPHGAVLWRARNDKQGVTHVTPLSRAARDELDLYLRQAARVGDVPLFPAPRNDAVPLGRRLASRWLLKAEHIAGLPKLEGGLWHPYRRAWATERKGLSDVDVAAVGGWTDVRTMHRSYQQSDAATMQRVAEGT